MNEDMIKNLENMLKTKEIPDNIKNMINQTSSSKNTNNVDIPKEIPNPSSHSKENDFDCVFESIKNSTFENKKYDKNDNNDDSDDNNDNSSPFSNIDMGTMMRLASIVNKFKSSPKNDPRTNLLTSLKPYLKPSRKEKIDQYIKFLNMTQVFSSLNANGGENKNDV